MALAPGSRIGPYEIQSTLGAGGMGEVYRGRDARLKRDVAIKVLPQAVALDPDRLGRFQREAQILASLNHPHIAAIYGVEESGDVRALVLELVEGPTLAERIARGPVPMAEAFALATQIALALEAAHDRGVIHRDLKPANIKLTPDGAVKVLDFGLAKALGPPDSSPEALLDSPTVSVSGTETGAILGTAAYMSPEQARGQPVDARTDVWSFGCVLYELLTTRRPFRGGTATDLLSAIVSREPDWSALPAATPAPVRSLLRRCLAKDLKRRLRHIGDARLELEDGHSSREASASPSAPDRRRERLAWTTAAVLAAILGWTGTRVLGRPAPAGGGDAPVVSRFLRLTSGPAHERAPAISPDGKWVAYLSDARGATDVWVKFIAGGDPVNLTASSGLALQSQSDIGGLAISPDGASIAFDAAVPEEGLPSFGAWVIPAPLGGVPRKLVADGRSVRWSPDGARIVYVVAGGFRGDALWVADADGGNAREVAAKRGGLHKHWPAWSADSRSIYFNNSISTANAEPASIYRVAVDGGLIEPVVTSTRRAVFPAPLPDSSGLVYGANPDTSDLSLWWKSVRRPDAPPQRMTTGVGEYAEPNVSADGRSVVATLVEVRQSLVRVSTEGPAHSPAPQPLTSGYTGDLDGILSPQGDRLVWSSTRAGNRNLWASRPDGAEARPLTSGTAIDERPAFSPDGRRIAFVSDRGGRRGIWVMSADGGTARALVAEEVLDAISWSRDGTRIVYAVPGDEPALRTVAVADGSVQPLPTPGPAAAPAWSPREDVIAYLENLPGRPGGPVTLNIRSVDATGRPVHEPIPAGNLGNGTLSWDRAGARLAVVGNSGSVSSAAWIFQPRGGQPPRKVIDFPPDVRLRGVTWSHDGRSLLVGQQRRTGDIVLFELARQGAGSR